MNADPELDAPVLRQARVPFDHCVLHFDRTPHSVDHAAKLDNSAVAGALDDASVMDRDRGSMRSLRIAARAQGVATEALSAMIRFCFQDLGLHRLQAFIHPAQCALAELIEKLGFRREGLLRENLRVSDEWRDDLLYARLSTDRPAEAGSEGRR